MPFPDVNHQSIFEITILIIEFNKKKRENLLIV
jgi:hypothetical protein